jgi:type IX secretion system PorP/SprF family membrane protein
VAIQPQLLFRYNADGAYKLPLNTDINLSAIFYQRFMIGATYRTDKSIEGIVHVQVARKFNIGYSYDYSTSDFGSYTKGAHELSIGFDFIRDLKDYTDPRFIQNY